MGSANVGCKLSKLLEEVSSVKQIFDSEPIKVNEFCKSGIFLNREAQFPGNSKHFLRQPFAIESEYQPISSPFNLLDHTNHINAIERDLEANFCLIRQIRCNLPYRRNWMRFLTRLTERDRNAAFKYYLTALKEVKLRGKSISSVHRLLKLLSNANAVNQHSMARVQQLTASNSSCETFCYDVWLQLLEMILFIEKRYMPSKTIKKSTIFALDHLQRWRKEISEDNQRSPKVTDESEQLCKRHRNDPWYSCLNDRLAFHSNDKSQKIKNTGVFHSEALEDRVRPQKAQNSCRFTAKRVLGCEPNGDSLGTLKLNMSNGFQANGQSLFSHSTNNPVVTNEEEKCVGSSGGNTSVKRTCYSSVNNRPINSFHPDSMGVPKVHKAPPEVRSLLLAGSRSPASILHSETRKVIAQMSTGSEIMRTSSAEFIPPKVHSTTGTAAYRVDSYLASVEASDTLVAQQHCNSNVELSSGGVRRSCSDDHLLMVAMTRTQSLNALNGPQTGKTISLSHSLEDTASYPFNLSEHLVSAWDNYQVPYYPSVEGISPVEPKAKLAEYLLWDDLFPNETEALDCERLFYLLQGATRQIDEWSFEGLSGTPFSSQALDDVVNDDNKSQSSEALLEPADRNPFSDDDQATPLRCSVSQDKWQQTDVDDLTNGIAAPSDSLNASRHVLPHDVNTTQTSGYESGPDLVNSLFQRSSLSSVGGLNNVNRSGLPTMPLTRNFGAQTTRRGCCKIADAIAEESSGSGFPFDKVYSECISQSERDIVKMREFLREIFASNVSGCDHSPLGSKIRKQVKSVFVGSSSMYNLMKSFNCMLQSAERNTRLFQRSGVWNSQHYEAFNQWNMLTKWMHSRALELKKMNDYQERIRSVWTKVNMLCQIADTLPNQNILLMNNCSPYNPQTLFSESRAVAEESQNLLDALREQKLHMNNKYFTVPSSLSDLETLFAECLDKILDRSIRDVRSLAEHANAMKSAFTHCEAVTDRSQTSNPIIADTLLSSDRMSEPASTSVSKQSSSLNDSSDRYIMDQGHWAHPWSSCVSSICPFLFFIVLIILFCIRDISPTNNQRLTFRCLGDTWAAFRALHLYRIGVPPQ